MGLRPKRGLGQNFLVDETIAYRIAEVAAVSCGDRLVEIGPGPGSLTRPLLDRVGTLWAIERDDRLLPLLRSRTAGKGTLHLISGDALTVDYRALAERCGGPLRIVSNLPYHISSPLLFHLLDQGDAIADMTLMFQREVADRILAPPKRKTYGTLSVHCQLWFSVWQAFQVFPEAFFPRPKVVSTVLRLDRRDQPLAEVDDAEFFRKLVRAAFGQRRKVLNNALKVLVSNPDPWLTRAGIDPNRRGETLTVVEFVRLANCAD